MSLREVETMLGRETAVRLCEWLKEHTPVRCREGQGYADGVEFDIDEAIEYAKIRIHQDSFKRAFFPHLVKLKHYKVCNGFDTARSA